MASTNEPPGDALPSGPHRDASQHEVAAGVEKTALENLFAHIPATVWMTDDRLVLTFIQGVVVRQFQLDPKTLVGRTLPDLLLDGREDHPIIQGHLTALAGHETSVRIEWGGNIYNARIAPLKNPDGRIIGCVGIQQRIGWLPDDEGTLRESDIRLRRVIDSNMIGILFGDDTGRITDSNDAFLQLTGYSREDFVTETISWPALTPVEYHQRQVDALQEILATGRCTPFEQEIIRRDGRRFTVVVGAARLSAERREGVAFVLDVSERKRVEHRLRAELTCADALRDAATLDDVGQAILQTMGNELEWDAAVLWERAADGSLQLIARHGPACGDDHCLEALAERAVTGRRPFWSDQTPPPSLAIPFVVADRCYGALVLVSRLPEGPDAELVSTSLAIGERVAKFLAKKVAGSA